MKTKHTPTPEQAQIIENGNFLKQSFGISQFFRWQLFELKGIRYNVSMFDNQIDQVNPDYCNVCGSATYDIKIVMGQYTCPDCAKEIE